MRVLQAAVAILGMSDPDTTDNSRRGQRPQGGAADQPVRPPRSAPTHRVRRGWRRWRRWPGCSHAANFLYMLTGQAAELGGDVEALRREPHALRRARAERLHLHDARHRRPTQSDMHSAVAGGVGALKGRLHGGAGRGGDAHADGDRRGRQRRRLRASRPLAEKRRLMGMGHRVYKAGDPRAAILKGMAEDACRQSGQFKWYEMAVKLHERIEQGQGPHPQRRFLLGAALLLARHPGRSLHAGDRRRPHRRLGGEHHRAARRQPADPSPRATTSAPSAALRPDREALTWAVSLTRKLIERSPGLRQAPWPAKRSASASTRCCSPTPTARMAWLQFEAVGVPARGAGARGDLHRPPTSTRSTRATPTTTAICRPSRASTARRLLQARQRHLPPGAHGVVLRPRPDAARHRQPHAAVRRRRHAGHRRRRPRRGGGHGRRSVFLPDAGGRARVASPARSSRGSPRRTSSWSCCGGSPCAGGAGKIFEYGGPGLPSLLAAQRMTIANMGAELTLTTSVFRVRRGHPLVPHAAGPRRGLAAGGARRRCDLRRPDRARPRARSCRSWRCRDRPIAWCRSTRSPAPPIDQVMVGSCTNGSWHDMASVDRRGP